MPRVALGFARAWQRIHCSFPPQWEITAGAAQYAIAPGRRRVLATSPGNLLHDGLRAEDGLLGTAVASSALILDEI